MTPREDLGRIAALYNGFESDPEVRAVLAEVSPEPGGDPYCGRPSGGERCGVCGSRQSCYPEPGGVLDRDQARKVLDLWAGGRIQYREGLLDRLAGGVRPAAIDRDALTDWIKGRDWREWNSPDEVVDGILALVRPVAGVTLTLEEAADLARVLAALRRPGGISIADLPEPARLDRLAEQLA